MSKIEEGIESNLMADKLTYKGGANVVNQEGSEMLLVNPAKGSTHRFLVGGTRKALLHILSVQFFCDYS